MHQVRGQEVYLPFILIFHSHSVDTGRQLQIQKAQGCIKLMFPESYDEAVMTDRQKMTGLDQHRGRKDSSSSPLSSRSQCLG